jgi:5-methylcytosine-specific restriction endonuclease McrA
MTGRIRSWTDDQLRHAVAQSFSIAQVLRALGLRAAGGNYIHVKEQVRLLGLDTSHLTGQAHWRGKKQPRAPRVPLEDILRRGTAFQSHKLRRRLIAAGAFEPKCSNCGSREWLGRPIPLELDHVDGDRMNNELSNLRLMCPNCHALTPTYRGKNIRRRRMPKVEQRRKSYLRRAVSAM